MSCVMWHRSVVNRFEVQRLRRRREDSLGALVEEATKHEREAVASWTFATPMFNNKWAGLDRGRTPLDPQSRGASSPCNLHSFTQAQSDLQSTSRFAACFRIIGEYVLPFVFPLTGIGWQASSSSHTTNTQQNHTRWSVHTNKMKVVLSVLFTLLLACFATAASQVFTPTSSMLLLCCCYVHMIE